LKNMDSRLHGNDGQEDGKYFFSNLLENEERFRPSRNDIHIKTK
jgi:hypothetical protein